MERFVSEVTKSKISLADYLKTARLPTPVPMTVISNVHRIVTYRNKLIVHPFVTTDFSISKALNQQWRLNPTNFLTRPGDGNDDDKILELKAVLFREFPELNQEIY